MVEESGSPPFGCAVFGQKLCIFSCNCVGFRKQHCFKWEGNQDRVRWHLNLRSDPTQYQQPDLRVVNKESVYLYELLQHLANALAQILFSFYAAIISRLL